MTSWDSTTKSTGRMIAETAARTVFVALLAVVFYHYYSYTESPPAPAASGARKVVITPTMVLAPSDKSQPLPRAATEVRESPATPIARPVPTASLQSQPIEVDEGVKYTYEPNDR